MARAHNLERAKVEFKEYPISYLLIVADELQEWQRYFRMPKYELLCAVDSIKLKIDPPMILAEIDYSTNATELRRTHFDFEKQFESKYKNLSRLIPLKIGHDFLPELDIRIISPEGCEH